MRIVNKSKVSGGNETRRTQLKSGRTFVFNTWLEATRFCEEHNLKEDKIIHKYKTYTITI